MSFIAHYLNVLTDDVRSELIIFNIDAVWDALGFDSPERDFYLFAMAAAYDGCHEDEYFLCLEFVVPSY